MLGYFLKKVTWAELGKVFSIVFNPDFTDFGVYL